MPTSRSAREVTRPLPKRAWRDLSVMVPAILRGGIRERFFGVDNFSNHALHMFVKVC